MLVRSDRPENHIHIELSGLDRKASLALHGPMYELGFTPDHFLSEQAMRTVYEERLQERGFVWDVLTTGNSPQCHYTRKFRGCADALEQKLQAELYYCIKDIVTSFIREFSRRYRAHGYMEAEHVIRYEFPDSAKQPFRASIRVPFSLQKAPAENKKADLHLSFSEDVDPRLITALAESGLYVVLMPKGVERPDYCDEVKFVLTAQGAVGQIKELMRAVLQYVGAAGGIGSSASAKIEIVDRIERTSNEVQINDVIQSIQ